MDGIGLQGWGRDKEAGRKIECVPDRGNDMFKNNYSINI